MAPQRRKGLQSGGGNAKKKPRPKLNIDLSGHGGKFHDRDDVTPNLNDEDVSSDDEELGAVSSAEEDDDQSEQEETLEAKRLRMAREYLKKVEAQDSSSAEGESQDDTSDNEDEQIAFDKVGHRIAKERLRKSGLLPSHIADSVLMAIQTMRGNIASDIGLEAATLSWMGGESLDGQVTEHYAKSWIDHKYVTYHRGHDLTPTCVALSHEGTKAYSGSKDGSIIMWNVEFGKRLSYVIPIVKHDATNSENNAMHINEREILAIATSDDDRYMAVGGRDNCVRIFDIRTLGNSSNKASPITVLKGHKKAVTTLAFRNRTLDLYSGSEDRCIRRYDLNSMTYIETLYGHQAPIISIDCANKNRPVTVARDRTVRVWKVEEDSHLVFRPGGNVGSAECVSAIQDGWFITGHDDGRLALWREEKKRPVGDVVVAAHGYEGGSRGVTRGVMCCNALGLSDVLATGSNDGYLRFWKVSTEEKNEGIKPLESIPIHGHINHIAMGPQGKFCVAAIGQEPRLGRWDRVPRAKNRLAIIKLGGINTGE